MYLHIGNGATVSLDSVIGIFDLDSATVSKVTKGFIKENQKNKNVIYEDEDLPRAFVLCGKPKRKNKKEEYKIRLSRISPQGLKNRTEEVIE